MRKLCQFYFALLLLLPAVVTAGPGTVPIGSGTNTQQNLPIVSCYGYNYSEQIVLASEYASGGGLAGNITKIRFYYDGGGTTITNWDNWTVYLKHTTKTSFASSTDWETTTAADSVFGGTITPVAGGWMEITLDIPFNYDGTSNILVGIDENVAGYSCSANWRSYTAASNQGIYYRNDNTNPDPTTPPTASGTTSNVAQIQFEGEVATCLPPSDLLAGILSTTSAELSWVETNSATTWDIEYDTAGFAPGTGNMVAATTSNPDTLTGLTPKTSYEFYVRADCGGGDISNWAGPYSFYTGHCVPSSSGSATYVDNFSTTNGVANISNLASGFTAGGWFDGTGQLVQSYGGAAFDFNADIVGGSAGFAIWVDWNKDLVFDDATEKVFNTTGYGFGPFTGTINIPNGTPVSNYTMRIVAHYNSSNPNNPCDATTRAEFEDYTVEVLPPPSCYPPANLTASNLTGYTADLGWTPSISSQMLWDIEYDTAGFAPGTGNMITGTTTNPHAIAGLTPSTNYEFYVRTDCGFGYGASTWAGPFAFTTTVSCLAPSGLTANGITDVAANLEWTENGAATIWNIEWDTTGFATGTGNTVTATTTNPHAISGLTAETTYQYYVQADCGGGTDTSSWTGPYSFTTACGAVAAPFNEDFENGGSIPNCWTMAGGENWLFNTSGPNHVGDGGTITGSSVSNAYYAVVDASGDDGAVALTSPLIDVSGLTTPYLTFYEISDNEGNDNSQLDVEVWDGAAWNNVAMYNTNTNGWEKKEISLGGLTFTGAAQVRFTFSEVITPGDFYDDIAIDDVTVEEAPTCIDPNTLAAINLTATTADLSWNANGGTTLWDIEWDTAGFTPTTGNMITGSTTNPHSISGLTATTNYEFYVRADCGGGDTSNWVGPFAFTTTVNCPDPTALDAINITASSADLTWNAVGGTSLWNIEWDTTGFTQGTGTMVAGTNNNPHAISGLAAETTYQYYVQADCGADSSAWVGPYAFYTGYCTPAPSSVDNNGITNVSMDTLNNTTSTELGNYGDYSAMIANAPQGTNLAIDVTLQTGYTYNLWVWVDWNDDLDFTDPGEEYYLGESSSANPTTFNGSISIPLTATMGNHRFRLGGADGGLGSTSPSNSCYTGSYASFEDYTINVTAAPTCFKPDVLTATNITGQSADLSWNAAGGSTLWNIEWDTAGFTPGTGTMVTSTTTNPHSISGLTATTNYEFYVTADCGATDGMSNQAGPFAFTTTLNSGVDMQTACNTFTWIDGNTYTDTNNTATHIITGGSADGSDSLVNLDLIILYSATGTDNRLECDFTWIDGNTYTANNNSATHNIVGGAANGCDSLVTLNYINLPFTPGTDTHDVCDSLTWIDGIKYTMSNNSATHMITGGASSGCDSLVYLDLTVRHATTGGDTLTQCPGFVWIDGNTYNVSNNTATHTLVNAAGCDSVVTLNLTVTSFSTATDTRTECDSVVWIDGNTYSANNNTAMHTLTGQSGCDSIVTLDLTIINSATSTDVQSACVTYTWVDGNTYTASNNTATHTIVGGAANGCDSIVTLDLTIFPTTSGTDVQTACNTYTWIDGNSYTASNNTATHTIVGGNANGCDSTVTLDLTVNYASAATTDTRTECDSYTWIDGNTYTANNNTATFTLTNAAGCDSVVALDLTIINSSTSTDVQTACNFYTWINGTVYFASNNTATHTLTNAVGCDSVVTLDLTINYTTSGIDNVQACDSYTWIDGVTYTANNNTATQTIVGGAANGCDSVVFLNLTINTIDLTTSSVDTTYTVSATFQVGATYQWLDCDNGNAVIPGATGVNYVVTASGNYAAQISLYGCVDTTACVNMDYDVGINEIANASFSIYPNPVRENLMISSTEKLNNITIYAVNGQVITTIANPTENQVNVSNLVKGMYIIEVQTNKGVSQTKFIKE